MLTSAAMSIDFWPSETQGHSGTPLAIVPRLRNLDADLNDIYSSRTTTLQVKFSITSNMLTDHEPPPAGPRLRSRPRSPPPPVDIHGKQQGPSHSRPQLILS